MNDKPVIEVKEDSHHFDVVKDGKIVERFDEILRPTASEDAYKLKKELEDE